MSTRDVIIVGGGPAGLAAAIAAKQAGLDYLVLEKGVLVNSIYHFPPNMIFFTTPELLEIGGLPLVSPFEKPTRLEALRYYRRVVETHDLQVTTGEAVLTVEPDPVPGEETHFVLETRTDRGVRRARHARAVILAIGYYDHPNLLNIPGEDLPHVSHYYTEAHPFYRQRVIVVGGGNSAAETSLDLFRSGAHVTLVHWRDKLKDTIKYWVRPDIENRIKEGSIPARFNTCVTEIRPASVVVTSQGVREELPADFVFLLTGYHPDNDLFRRIGVQLDERTTAAVHDPETFETNVRGIFVAGGAISGRDTSPIFIENGRFHGEKIVGVIRGRIS
jgi:thioredoxin reductase (NADPH)